MLLEEEMAQMEEEYGEDQGEVDSCRERREEGRRSRVRMAYASALGEEGRRLVGDRTFDDREGSLASFGVFLGVT